ncbi:SDR family NAD(P)-dependent oxidoreductase [Chitinophaga nivalis]|uniref:SDR family NAD(P)-dependent oxidoreductase n=1 Tax=Chitinophaga nivalis TaxID=2991709 RepID=A0ABT3IIC9_9BACT|nr:SDR family NAD(P)-dependent oxidoreductase [Chitinophaga nivalis]MCW3466584.1 SDR family NAD(P)-dependent oxidoreductase [Chitinophaga nivalis]MCW3483725.1 SDR family NAD(P)-dependent oxidoreductase [Chitinophaga nivalis]
MRNKIERISILSCGWLGKPLAVHLQQAGYQVKGARTSATGVAELKDLGLDGYVVRLDEEVLEGADAFWEADLLIVNIPPRSRRERGPEAHVGEMKLLRSFIETTAISKVLFISSTSVYADINGLVTEENEELPETPNGESLRTVEKILMESEVFVTTVLRFGGLIGYDRLPTQQSLDTGRRSNDVPMNVIHRDDCIGVIAQVIAKDVWGEIFNACASVHPLRYNYLKAAAKAFNLQLPKKLQPEELPYKIVSSAKLKRMLHYNFIYDDPLSVFNGS